MPETCQSPVCQNPLPEVKTGWRRTERLYCSQDCKKDVCALKRVREKLKGLSDEEIVQVIRNA
jgi:hypothetical protein